MKIHPNICESLTPALAGPKNLDRCLIDWSSGRVKEEKEKVMERNNHAKEEKEREKAAGTRTSVTCDSGTSRTRDSRDAASHLLLSHESK